jgi:5-methylcytosine-specific restriction endonuclease McrA
VIHRFCPSCNRPHPHSYRCPLAERSRYANSAERQVRSTARWQRVRAAVRGRDGERCTSCGSARDLQVHHVVPLHAGGAEFELSNLTTLCAECHARIGGGRGQRKTTPSHPRPVLRETNTGEAPLIG